MAYNIRWRRAAIVSVLCHIVLFLGAGYLSAYMFTTPAVEEQIVELDLVGEFQAADYKDTAPTASPAAISQAAATSQTVSSTVAATEPMSTVTTETMSVITTDNAGAKYTAVTATSGDAGGGTGGPGGKGKATGIIPPGILNKVAPSYPKAARQAGIEGTVVLKVQILENGRAGSVSIARSSGNDLLDDAAIAAVEQWMFVPAKDTVSHQAVACYTTLPISFHLQ